jgi:hypothetical protein
LKVQSNGVLIGPESQIGQAMSVSSSIWTFIVSQLFFFMLLKWPKRHGAILEDSRVSIVRRVAAFYIDGLVAMLGVMPIAVMPTLIAEYHATGEWLWSFNRDYPRATDWIIVASVLAAFYCIFWYFRWHFVRQKQTVGQHLLKFKLVPTRDNPSLGLRFFVAWICGAWWPLWPWTIFKEKQDYYWDTVSGIKARRVSTADISGVVFRP